jgi:transcription elongation factor GreA
MNELLITPSGLRRLAAELDRLKTTERRASAERLKHAAETDCDRAANADFLSAREEHALLEAKIARLERRLAASEVAEADAGNGVVDLGERVRLRNLDTGARMELELVGAFETDLHAGRISAASPLGRAVLGRRKGEIAVVDAPRGTTRYKITSISAVEAGR